MLETETAIDPDPGVTSRITQTYLREKQLLALHSQEGFEEHLPESELELSREFLSRFIRHIVKRNPKNPEFSTRKAIRFMEAMLSPVFETKTVSEMVEEEFARVESRKDRSTVGLVGRSFLPGILAEIITQEDEFISTPLSNTGKGGEVMYHYEEGTFLPNGADYISVEANRLLSFFDESKPSRLSEVNSLIRITNAVDQERMNNRAMELVNCLNGMLDWKSGSLIPHDPKYLCTFQIKSKFDPEAKSPRLDEFFETVFNADAIDLVEEFIGYLLLPTSQFQKCFIALGPGGNGKSTFLTILENFLGKASLSFESLHELSTSIFSRANLLDSIGNFHHEVSSQMLEGSSVFKSLVSGDTISAQFKHKNAFTFTPFARLVFAANEFPTCRDSTDAYYQRLIFVEFKKVFRGTSEEIPNFAEKVCEDPEFCAALFNRALTGLKRLMKNGKFSPCASSDKLLESHKLHNSSSLQMFVEEALDFGAHLSVIQSDLHPAYMDFCKEVKKEATGRNRFLEELKAYPGITPGRAHTSTREDTLKGIGWKPEFDSSRMPGRESAYGSRF
jgi:putative DNA primase/helicase